MEAMGFCLKPSPTQYFNHKDFLNNICISNYVLELAHIYMSWHHNMHLNKFAENLNSWVMVPSWKIKIKQTTKYHPGIPGSSFNCLHVSNSVLRRSLAALSSVGCVAVYSDEFDFSSSFFEFQGVPTAICLWVQQPLGSHWISRAKSVSPAWFSCVSGIPEAQPCLAVTWLGK